MFKKLVVLFLFFHCMLSVFAQNATDALRYSQVYFNSTARIAGLGGAFGSLGGDFGSISLNPGGLGVYRSGEFSFTSVFNDNSVKSTFLGQKLTDNRSNLSLINNISVVSCFNVPEAEESGWMNFNIGIGYNRLNNFNRNIAIEGTNTNSSMVDVLVTDMNENNQNSLDLQDLSYETYLTDYDSTSNEYWSFITDARNIRQTQKKVIDSKGSMGEYVFAAGFNYNHQLYLGGAIGISNISYEEKSEYSEIDEADSVYMFEKFYYRQNLKTQGSGFNIKIGAIYKPIDWCRIGIAWHSPVYYSLGDEYSPEIETFFKDGGHYKVNIPSNSYDMSQYQLTTPSRFISSLAFIINKAGLVSFDAEMVDYSTTRFQGETDFEDVNQTISNLYKRTGNYRFGMEYKFGVFGFRGGFAFYGSPHAKDNYFEPSSTAISAGFGIREKKFFVDFAYIQSTLYESQFLYDVLPSQEPVKAEMTTTSKKLMLSIGIKF